MYKSKKTSKHFLCLALLSSVYSVPTQANLDQENLNSVERIIALLEAHPIKREQYACEYEFLKNYAHNKSINKKYAAYMLSRAGEFLQESHEFIVSDKELQELAQELADHIQALTHSRFISTPGSVSDPRALSLGEKARAIDKTSTAIGTESFAATGAAALGYQARAAGLASLALGGNYADSSSSATSAQALGTSCVADGGASAYNHSTANGAVASSISCVADGGAYANSSSSANGAVASSIS